MNFEIIWSSLTCSGGSPKTRDTAKTFEANDPVIFQFGEEGLRTIVLKTNDYPTQYAGKNVDQIGILVLSF